MEHKSRSQVPLLPPAQAAVFATARVALAAGAVTEFLQLLALTRSPRKRYALHKPHGE